MNQANIKVLSFTGKQIKDYIPSVAKLTTEVRRDYPFLQIKHLEEEVERLKKYAETPEAIVVIVFDGSAIVGASTGIPFHIESKTLHQPFLKQKRKPSEYFYFSESLLLKPYRGRGIAHYFFDLREEHVEKNTPYKKICFYTIKRPLYDKKKPTDHLPLDDFWRKRGFAEHPELSCRFTWKDLEEQVETEKQGTFWICSLEGVSKRAPHLKRI